jgi:hypothetical protein
MHLILFLLKRNGEREGEGVWHGSNRVVAGIQQEGNR